MSSLHEIREVREPDGHFVWVCMCDITDFEPAVSEQEARWGHWAHQVHADVAEAGMAS